MKHYLVILTLCCFAQTAWANSQVETVLEQYIKAWNQHNKHAISEHYAKNVTWYDLATNQTVTGKAQVAPAITGYFMDSVEGMYWHKSGDVFVSGNTIIYEWAYGGHFNGQWGYTKITKKPFSIKGISTTTIDDAGKIVAQKDYYDMDSFKRALGVL